MIQSTIQANLAPARPSILHTPHSNHAARRYLRLLLVAVAIAGCLFAVRSAAAFGLSRLLATYSLTARNLGVARKAVGLTPKDAEAHFVSAVILGMSETPAQSIPELEQAVALRPADYTLWQQLGLLRDQAGDKVGALAAFDESIKRAPFYSQPRWNRGNVLLRSGEYEAAFRDLNQAAKSNPDLIPILLDLAWGISRGDVKLTEQLTQIEGDKMRLAFARLLARRGVAQEVIVQLRQAGDVSEAVRRELTDQLSARGAFKEAFEIWNNKSGLKSEAEQPAASIYDGGFEGTLSFNQSGFGWRVSRDLQAYVSLDSGAAHSGSKNLRIEFSGNRIPNVFQLILVEPSTHYKVNFASQSRDLVTGGLPFLAVSDAAPDSKHLGQSAPLGKGTTDWQTFSFEFSTTPTTTAVVLSLQRENCTTSPCPIFGSLALDSFSLEQLK